MIALDGLQLALMPSVKTMELVEVGVLGDGTPVQIERDLDDECCAWVGQDWFELTLQEYQAIRALVIR